MLGREIAERVARAFPGAKHAYFHTNGDEEHLIAQVRGEAALVPPLADPEELAPFDAVIVTATPSHAIAARLTSWLRAHPRVAVVDASEAGLDLEEARPPKDSHGSKAPAARRTHLVDPSLAAPAAFVAALAPLQPLECHLTLLCPAAGFGADALVELAAQGVARLSGVAPGKPEALPEVLAFDVAPAAGARRERIGKQLAGLLPGLECHLQLVDTGVFHGHVALARLRCAVPPREGVVRGLLRSSASLRLARRTEHVRPSDAMNQDQALCAELSCDGPWVSAWLAADGVRLGTLAGVVAALEALTAS